MDFLVPDFESFSVLGWIAFGVPASLVLLVVYCYALTWMQPSYGSGANPYWNKYIDANPPSRRDHVERLEDGWVYTGKRAIPAKVVGEVCKDAATGLPLTGTLIGRQTWEFAPDRYEKAAGVHGKAEDPAYAPLEFNPAQNPHSADLPLRGQMLARHGRSVARKCGEAEARGISGGAKIGVEKAMRAAVEHIERLQSEDGHWPGDYGGPFFLLPGLVITAYVSKFDLGAARKRAMLLYLRNHQQVDGGWPLHLEGPSTMFGTVLNYVAARLLGRSADEPNMKRARAFIHKHGGACTTPQWGKLWLCVLGVFEYEGMNPVPPELWLLPSWFPFHPAKMWCHSRMVYLPMSYVYGARLRAEDGPLQQALREELYVEKYEDINWSKQRHRVCPIDLYSPHTVLMDVLFDILSTVYEPWPIQPLRRAALDFVKDYMHAEDIQTNFVDIGPVNKSLNMLCTWAIHGSDHEYFLRHAARIDDYLWVAEDGMKMNGYNGSQLWDAAFLTQAVVESGLSTSFPTLLRRANFFVDQSQIKEDEVDREKWFRCPSKGGWPFSTNDHGWPIADCTAEGLKAALALRDSTVVPEKELIPVPRLYQAVDMILFYQNRDGGWATYERNRGYDWYEWLNPAEVFGDIMIDYSYIELSSTCIEVLRDFQERFPAYKPGEVSKAMERGVAFVRRQQRPDGSFYGSWAVCFTYAAMFAANSLTAAGDPEGEDKVRLEKMCKFLLSKQREDGGWGESYLSCVKKTYHQHESTAFNTAWALLALITAQCSDHAAIERGVQHLLASQLESGDWPQESVAGVFNRSTAIVYSNYRNAFPLRALAAYAHKYHLKDIAILKGGSSAAKRFQAAFESAPSTSSSSSPTSRSPTPSSRKRTKST